MRLDVLRALPRPRRRTASLGPSAAAWAQRAQVGVTELLCLQVLDDFSKQVDSIHWPVGSPAIDHYTALDGYLSTYQVSAQTVETSQPW